MVFILKVFGLAALLSILIKGVGPLLAIPPSAGVSLLLVLLPTVVMASFLGWQAWESR